MDVDGGDEYFVCDLDYCGGCLIDLSVRKY